MWQFAQPALKFDHDGLSLKNSLKMGKNFGSARADAGTNTTASAAIVIASVILVQRIFIGWKRYVLSSIHRSGVGPAGNNSILFRSTAYGEGDVSRSALRDDSPIGGEATSESWAKRPILPRSTRF